MVTVQRNMYWFAILAVAVALSSASARAQSAAFSRVQTPDLNGVRFVTTSCDDAEKACGTSACIVVIPSNYTGADCTNLMTTSTGYKVYKGPNNVTIVDLRANAATPATSDRAPLYPIIYGGRLAGQIQRLGVNEWTGGKIPGSTSGATFFNWIGDIPPSTATLPPYGDQFGLIAVAMTHDSVTVGASPARVAAIDAEAIINATRSDKALPDVRGVTAAVEITRAGATQSITNASVFLAHDCTNDSRSGATIANCYGFHADRMVSATTRNYGFYNQGNWLTDNDKYFDVLDSGGHIQHVINWRPDDIIDYKPLSDKEGWNWLTDGGRGLFTITASLITSRVTHQFESDVVAAGKGTFKGGMVPGDAAAPACNAAHRGTFWYQPGDPGVKDVVAVCAKDAMDTYAWRRIY